MRLRVLAAACLVTLAGCDSNPAQPTCTFTLSTTSMTMGAAGGAGSVTVTTGNQCAWTASSGVSWITATGGTAVTGPGAFTFTVAALASATSRNGSLTVAGQAVSVTQQGIACAYALLPASRTFDAAGATATFDVNTDAACGWTAAATAPWLSVVSGGSGIGQRHSHLPGGRQSRRDVAHGQPHRGRPVAHGHPDRPQQLHGRPQQVPGLVRGCRRQRHVRRRSAVDLRVGGHEHRRLGAGDRPGGRRWHREPPRDVRGGCQSRRGSRSGTIAVGGRTFTITQAGTTACEYSVAPVEVKACMSVGYITTITVSTAAGCPWTSSTPASWITIASGLSGSGPGTMTFSMASNFDAARQANVEVRWPTPTAGQNVRVLQAGCLYNAGPTFFDVPSAGGDYGFEVVSQSTDTSLRRAAAERLRVERRRERLVGDGAELDAALRRRPPVVPRGRQRHRRPAHGNHCRPRQDRDDSSELAGSGVGTDSSRPLRLDV